MKLTGMGKLVLVIIAAGIAIGGWRWWEQQQTGGTSGSRSTRPGWKLPALPLPGKKAAPAPSSGEIPAIDSDGAVTIPFVITAAKKDWVQDQINRFNESQAGKYRIVAEPIPSREAMHAILSGKTRPVLWSPGSPIWPNRLAEAWSANYGNQILNLDDPNAYRVYLRSPLVFLTTRARMGFLRPLLGSNEPWLALRRLSTGQVRPPWGRFTFSHADPLTSSSGMLTIGLILYDYAQRQSTNMPLERVAKSGNFMAYLRQLETSLIYDKPAEEGTTKLTKVFLADTARYDVITAYEAAALEAAEKDGDIAVIYPRPTAVSEHAVSLLSAGWVTPQQREGALEFMAMLGTREALQDGLKYRFRPVQQSGSLSLSPQLAAHAAQGFSDTYASVELPPYQALNTAAFQWRVHIARKPPA